MLMFLCLIEYYLPSSVPACGSIGGWTGLVLLSLFPSSEPSQAGKVSNKLLEAKLAFQPLLNNFEFRSHKMEDNLNFS